MRFKYAFASSTSAGKPSATSGCSLVSSPISSSAVDAGRCRLFSRKLPIDEKFVIFFLHVCTPNSSRAIPRPRPAPAALRSKTRRSLHLRVTRSPSGLNTTLEKYTERLSLDIPRTRLFCSRLQLRKNDFVVFFRSKAAVAAADSSLTNEQPPDRSSSSCSPLFASSLTSSSSSEFLLLIARKKCSLFFSF